MNNGVRLEKSAEIYENLPGEGDYATTERQYLYDDHTLALLCTAALRAWKRIGEEERKFRQWLNLYMA